MSASRRSAARTSWMLKQVSRMSEEVSPWWTKRASGPTISARWVRKAMTSCLVSRLDGVDAGDVEGRLAALAPDGLRGRLRHACRSRPWRRGRAPRSRTRCGTWFRATRWPPFRGANSAESCARPAVVRLRRGLAEGAAVHNRRGAAAYAGRGAVIARKRRSGPSKPTVYMPRMTASTGWPPSGKYVSTSEIA